MQPRNIRHLIVDIDSITPHPKNVRHGDIGAISESLKAHGQYRPIVVDERTGQILAGNHTWKAAKALGWSQIQASFIETKDDDEALRILLADNKANDLATYNDDELINLLKQLAETDEGLEGTLFDGDDLDALIAEQEHFELPADVDEIPEQVAGVSKLGDVWLLGEHRVMCGDSLIATNLDLLMNGKKAGCVLTDPPYGMNLDADYSKMPVGNKNSKMNRTPNKYRQVIGDDKQFDATSLRLFFINTSEQFWFGADYYRRTLSLDDRDGSWLIWDKRKEDGSQDDVLGSTFETCWSSNPHQRRILRHYWVGAFGKTEARNRLHPTQKPISLMAEIITRWTDKDCVVVDLFGGSGSTLIAAQETNRIAYLMELDPRYVDVICARYQKHTGNQPMLEATGEPHNFLLDAN